MKKIQHIPEFDRPREKLISLGPEALSETELLAILIGSGIKGKDVISLSNAVIRLLDKHSKMLTVNDLEAIDGIGCAKACQIVAAVEFSRRRFFRDTVVIKNAGDVIPYISHIALKKQEHFLSMTLNGANEIISTRLVTIGLLNATQIHPREVFADAISDRAASIIIAHNHPSGMLEPSRDDVSVTRQLVSAGEILGISVLDHIIISKKGYVSFKDKGLL